MPLDDFRRQVDGETVSFDLLGTAPTGMAVSLTRRDPLAGDCTPRAVLVASRDDHSAVGVIQRGHSIRCLFATRKNTIELPSVSAGAQPQLHWRIAIARHPGAGLVCARTGRDADHRDDKVAQFGYKLTLLVMPEAERRVATGDEDEEPVEDSWRPVSSPGQKPYRVHSDHASCKTDLKLQIPQPAAAPVAWRRASLYCTQTVETQRHA